MGRVYGSDPIAGDILDLEPGDKVSGFMVVDGRRVGFVGVFTCYTPHRSAVVRFDYPIPSNGPCDGPDGYRRYDGRLLSYAFDWKHELHKVKGAKP